MKSLMNGNSQTLDISINQLLECRLWGIARFVFLFWYLYLYPIQGRVKFPMSALPVS